MRYSEICEAVGPSVLYHGTSMANLLAIIHEDCIRVDHNPISLTRSKDVALRFGIARAYCGGEDYCWDPEYTTFAEAHPLACTEWEMFKHYPDNSHGAILILDRERLSHRYKLVPTCEGGGQGGANGQSKWEMEEQVSRSITPVKPLIVGVCIPALQKFTHDYCPVVIEGWEEHNIAPQPQMKPVIDWILARAQNSLK